MKAILAALILLPTIASADPAFVENVQATQDGETWRFAVTLRHDDTGWDDYADGWRIETATGEILGERPLAHPHETEQPFTRAQSGIAIAEGTTTVNVRASTNVEGWADSTTPFVLPD